VARPRLRSLFVREAGSGASPVREQSSRSHFGIGLAVDDSTEEPERFGDVVTVETDILSSGLGILPYPTLNIWWLC
jgi:hypothetical protein